MGEKRGGFNPEVPRPAESVPDIKEENPETELDEKLLPRVDKKTGIYTDPDGREWASGQILSRMLSIGVGKLREFIIDVPEITGFDRAHRKSTLYLVSEVLDRARSFFETPRVDIESGIYVDEAGESWSNLTYFSHTYSLGLSTVQKILRDNEHIVGRDRINKIVKLYKVRDFLTQAEFLLDRPRTDPETGMYTDQQGNSWAAKAYYLNKFGHSAETIIADLPKESVIEGRDRNGRRVLLYQVSAVEPRLMDTYKLPAIDPDTGYYLDAEGRKWVAREYFRKDSGLFPSLDRMIEVLATIHGRDQLGRATTFYSLDDAIIFSEKIRASPRLSEEGEYVDSEGEIWVNIPYLVKKFDLTRDILVRLTRHLPSTKMLNHKGLSVPIFSLQQIENIVHEYRFIPEASSDTGVYTDSSGSTWISRNYMREQLRLSEGQIDAIASSEPSMTVRISSGLEILMYRIDESIMRQGRDNNLAASRSSEARLRVVDNATGLYVDDSGKQWTTRSHVLNDLKLSQNIFEKMMKEVPTINGLSENRLVKLYPVNTVRELLSPLAELPAVDRKTGVYIDPYQGRWVAHQFFSNNKPISYLTVTPWLEQVSNIPGRDRIGKPVTLYSLDELEVLIEERTNRPKIDSTTGFYVDEEGSRWAPRVFFSRDLGIPDKFFAGITEEIKSISGRNSIEQLTNLYNIDEVMKIFAKRKEHFGSFPAKSPEDFVLELEQGKTVDAENFRKLVTFCGASRAMDILFKFRPEYKKIPIDYVKDMLAEYLGEYLSIKRGFKLKDIEPIAGHFSDLTLKEGLYETLKQDCLGFYYAERRKGGAVSDRAIIDAYLDRAVHELGDLNNKDIDDVVQNVVTFFDSLFLDIEVPDQLVTKIREGGRDFPDVNQRINYHELKDKKRLLIADEMGLGKSGSVIFAKETLPGVNKAVLVVPANVIPTWQKYLKEEEEGGYFKTGFGPEVLVVSGRESLHDARAAKADYIIISQERLGDKQYVEELKALQPDMVIIDEMHLLKNIEGKRAQQMEELSTVLEGENKYLALLSGTPVPNTVSDIAMALKLLYPEKFGKTDNDVLVGKIVGGDILDLRSLLIPRMQMKTLRESVEMPALREDLITVEMNSEERVVYEMLLEEDEIAPTQKIQLLRQFLMNPEMIDPTPGLESSKIKAVSEAVRQAFATKKKIVLFVNGYVEDVLRGEKNILDKLDLPEDVKITTIHGEVKVEERRNIQQQISSASGRMLVLVSGQTASVGVDFSAADEVMFYNEPWTEYDRRQQLGRVYRPGLSHDLESTTFIEKRSIEEGIHKYILAKYQSIEKLLRGIPLTEIEQELLLKTGDGESITEGEVNPELAKYYFSAWERMMNIFSYVKEIGETDFQKFLADYSREYAECYMELGTRSYQANANRVSGAFIDTMIRERNQKEQEVTILDLASGPEMLRNHIDDSLHDRVVSMDLNALHLKGGKGKRVAGSFLALPFRAESADYMNLTLAWHYTNFVPSKGKLERIEVLQEMNRVLKEGGRVVLNLIYSLDLKNEEHFKQIVGMLGFRIVEGKSGVAESGGRYASQLYTLEKTSTVTKTSAEISAELKTAGILDGLKFRQNKKKLRDSRGILINFMLGGERVDIRLNVRDRRIYEEEQQILKRGNALKKRYENIESIPKQEVVGQGFSRVFNGKRYVLFSRLKEGPGVVVIR